MTTCDEAFEKYWPADLHLSNTANRFRDSARAAFRAGVKWANEGKVMDSKIEVQFDPADGNGRTIVTTGKLQTVFRGICQPAAEQIVLLHQHILWLKNMAEQASDDEWHPENDG